MTPSPRARRALTAAALAAACAGTVLLTAAPSSAGRTAETRYGFVIAFQDAVRGTVTTDATDASPLGLVDRHDPTAADVGYATRYAASEALAVDVQRKDAAGPETMACGFGGENYGAGLQLSGGATPDWLGMTVGGEARARLRLSCTVDGVVHHLHYASYKSGSSWTTAPTPDCLVLTRTGTDTWELVASGCSVQDAIMPTKPGKVISSTQVTADFTATITRGGVLR